MYNMSMNYFDGLQLIRAQDSPVNRKMFDKVFEAYYALQYNHHGPFVFSRGNESLCKYNGPYAFITYPGIRFRYGTTAEEPRHHCYVCFKGPRVEKFIDSGLLPINSSHGLIKIDDPEEFHLTFMELLGEFLKNQSSIPRCVNLLEKLLLQLYESTGNAPANDDKLYKQIEKLGSDIIQNPRRLWDFKEAAQQLKISYPHFRRVFSKMHNSPPGQFLLNARLEHAAKMLINSDIPIKRIAEKICIEDIHHFSKLFKRKFHLPPGKYRKDFAE